MIIYRLKIGLGYLTAMVVAVAVWVLVYRLLFSSSTQGFIAESSNPTLAFGISTITVLAPLFAIMEALVSWLKTWRENRIKRELIRVIEALSTSPEGMDVEAIRRESGLPGGILNERVNELILLGRIGVKLTVNNHREYYLKG